MPGFFDTFDDLKRPAGRTDDDDLLTPQAFNKLVEASLKKSMPARFGIRGEISNFSRHRTSGHLYFTLKDENASVDCVMFAQRASTLRFDPDDGQDVVVEGSVGVYVPRGRYQIYVQSMRPMGVGSLEMQKRQTEARLRAEGLLDDDRKRALPRYPRRVALVSSRQAAGFADILKVWSRVPMIEVEVVDVPVQGATAAPKIVERLEAIFSRWNESSAQSVDLAESVDLTEPVDLIVLARGGGSLEDLWAFNDEQLARTIARSPVPVVTGIGHEIDVSIADLVADHHAHTPTEAANVVARGWLDARQTLARLELDIGRAIRVSLGAARGRLARIERHESLRRPEAIFRPLRIRLDEIDRALEDAWADRIDRASTRLNDLSRAVEWSRVRIVPDRRSRLDRFDAQLRALDPKGVLHRGYSITRRSDGTILTRAADLTDRQQPGEILTTQFVDGMIVSRLVGPEADRQSKSPDDHDPHENRDTPETRDTPEGLDPRRQGRLF